MRRRTNPARVASGSGSENRSSTDVLQHLADRALDMLDDLLNRPIELPYSPIAYGHIPGLYESLHGDLCAQGDLAIVELLRRHTAARGTSTPEVLAIVQMCGRYGARVFASPGSVLSVEFPAMPNERVLAMLSASGMQRVVGERQWLWSENPSGANLLTP